MRLIAADEEAERAAGFGGGRRRVPALNEYAPRPPRPLKGAPLPPAHRPTSRGGHHGRNARRLRALREKQRLTGREAKEAYRQIRDHNVHNWLKKHSCKAVPRTDLSQRRRELLMGCFELLDGDHSGTVDPTELGLASARARPPPSLFLAYSQIPLFFRPLTRMRAVARQCRRWALTSTTCG